MSHTEISAAEEMMKLAINGQDHVDSLIGYYRDLIDSYNNERAEWVLHYNNVNTAAEDQYLLEKELNHVQAQMSDLHQNLALKKAELTAERQRYFKLLENNGTIKKRLQESRSNYRELMNTCKPVGLNNSSILNASRNEASKPSILKQTNSKTAELQLQLINTNKDHEKKKAQMKEKISKLKNQLNGLMSEYQDRQEQDKTEYERSLDKLCDLQKKYITLTSEFFRFRTTNAAEQKKIQQQNQITRLKNLAILQKLKSLQKDHSEQFKNVDAQVKKQNKKFKAKYDQQLKKKQEHLSILKQQHERIQDIYLNKVKKLEQELRTTNQKLKVTEQKTRVQVSSIKSQIKILRTRLQKQGLHELRKQIANDDDQSSQSLEISDLERINQEVKNLERQLDPNK